MVILGVKKFFDSGSGWRLEKIKKQDFWTKKQDLAGIFLKKAGKKAGENNEQIKRK